MACKACLLILSSNLVASPRTFPGKLEGEYCSAAERRQGLCPDQWDCSYCDPGEDYGDHYIVVIDDEEQDLLSAYF